MENFHPGKRLDPCELAVLGENDKLPWETDGAMSPISAAVCKSPGGMLTSAPYHSRAAACNGDRLSQKVENRI